MSWPHIEYMGGLYKRLYTRHLFIAVPIDINCDLFDVKEGMQLLADFNGAWPRCL